MADSILFNIFLSYDVDNPIQNRDIGKVVDLLSSIDDLFNVDVKSNAKSVQGADLMVAFFSEKFQANDSCRQDVQIFVANKTPILFVKMQKDNFAYADWLKPIVDVNIYVDFASSPNPGLDILRHICKHLKIILTTEKEEKAQQAARRLFPRFQLFGIPSPSQYLPRKNEENEILSKLAFMNQSSNSTTVLLVTGVEGVGKTTTVAQVLRTESDYLKEECKITVVFWLDCSKCGDKIQIENQLLQTVQHAAPDSSFHSVEAAIEHFIKQGDGILVVFDDPKTVQHLEWIQLHPDVKFIVITQSKSAIERSPPFTYELPMLTESECIAMFTNLYGFSSNLIPETKVVNLAKLAGGLPRRISDIAAKFRKCRTSRDFAAVYEIVME